MKRKPNELSDAERMTAARRAVRVSGLRLLPEPARADQRATRAAPNGEEFDHRFLASTELLASDGAVILLDGWQVEKFMRRPRWIACHDIFGFSGPITRIALGRVVWIGLEDGLDVAMAGPTGRGLVAYVRYASTPFAQEVKTLYDEGGLDDVSVRWDPFTEVRRPATLDERKRYGEQCDWIIEYAELIELSSVLLGADTGAQQMRGEVRSAVARCRAAGHALPILEAMGAERADESRADADYDLEDVTGRPEVIAPAPATRAEGDEDEDEAQPAEPAAAETSETPAEQPSEAPAEQPSEQPTEQPAADESETTKAEDATEEQPVATDEEAPTPAAEPDAAALRSAIDALGEVVGAARQGFSAFGDVLVQMEQRMAEIRNLLASADAIADDAAVEDGPRGAVTLDDLEDLRAEMTLLHRALGRAADAATRQVAAPSDASDASQGFVFDLTKLMQRERPGNRATA